ncbi:hypothetical protein Brsp03_02403 [Brucella sp. NBRC 12951]|uniref:Kiwa anti-phage protein KwaB-like domain-containing protein n=1 Tax=Brucella sp. NBRC 12951 TaxID=3075479 RepID=UPI00309B7887
MPALQTLQSIDLNEAEVFLWIFKKSYRANNPTPRFKGRWITTTPQLDEALKAVVTGERERITEVLEYSLLAQNNESSALGIQTIETHAGLIADEVAEEAEHCKIVNVKDILNADFYLIKIVSDGGVIHAVRKLDSSWGTKKANNKISAIFSDHQLTVDDNPVFDIYKNVDFFIIGDEILVSNKGKFESILSYKLAHKEYFDSLKEEEKFLEIFTDVGPISEYVGNNKIQLRRAAAIQTKAHYRNVDFMKKLRSEYKAAKLNILFDADGTKIVPTLDTCPDIFRALLDHRLSSLFSGSIYDVPDATSV